MRDRHRRPADADVRLEQLSRPDARTPRSWRPRAKPSLQYGAGTTGSRTANGTFGLHEELERELADWFGKRHALIFSTGYQANLSVIGGLCGPDDVILIDSDSHASIYDATRQTASQVVAFRHNSPESLRKKLERLPKGQRNRLVVAEGLYSIRGDVAPLREIVDVCRAHGAYLLVDEAHSLGTYGADRPRLRRGAGRPRSGRLHRRHVLEIAGGHRRRLRVGSQELRALHFLARAYVFTASGSPANIASVRAAVRVVREHPELREQLWANIRRLRDGLQEMGYVIGATRVADRADLHRRRGTARSRSGRNCSRRVCT